MGGFINLMGQKFGRLTVIKRADDYISPNGYKATMWLCKCDCGNEIIVRTSDLRSKRTKSCGCLWKDAHYKSFKKYNKYDLSGEYGIGYTSNGKEFYFDLEDYDLIKDYCWAIRKDGYVISDKTLLSRLVMGNPDGLEVDHIHGKFTRNDNRKSNLRIVTKSKNAMNVAIKKNNTSGIVGVGWNKKRNKWRAYITINNKMKELGCFDNINDAIKARKEAEEKYFGEYSYENSQKKGESNNE